ncbi:hypothetical protein [Paenibacillus taiwanensis]|uniref:hypothetical protein n=1 Tax=Paenibacillus taiwanensis TaxID=401638 RepID=UPI00040B374D|nr:hypothetical protein [Paenibacillus taiwanensis]
MAAVNMPNVNSIDPNSKDGVEQLHNAVAKMSKELSWLLQNIDWKNINHLYIELNGGASVTIENDGITVNDGTHDTFTVNSDGKVKMTGATIQSKDSAYPKVVMDPEKDLFGAYQSPTQSVEIGTYRTETSSPYVGLFSSTESYYHAIFGDSYRLFGSAAIQIVSGLGREIILTGEHVYLEGKSFVDVPNWNRLRNKETGLTATQTFAAKGIQTDQSISFNGGIAPGTQLMVAGGGTVTWMGIPAHSHTQN